MSKRTSQGKQKRPPSPGNPPISFLDQGLFTFAEVDVKAIVLRWDALHDAPVLHIGTLDPWTAHAWLAAACEQLSFRLGEIVIEED